jgi:hypothetical protein
MMEEGYTTCFSGSAIIRSLQVHDLILGYLTFVTKNAEEPRSFTPVGSEADPRRGDEEKSTSRTEKPRAQGQDTHVFGKKAWVLQRPWGAGPMSSVGS